MVPAPLFVEIFTKMDKIFQKNPVVMSILVPDELKVDQAQSVAVFSLEGEIQGLSVWVFPWSKLFSHVIFYFYEKNETP